MTPRLGALVLCMAVWGAAEYQYDYDEVEELNKRLGRCLRGLPAVTLGKPFDLDATDESESAESTELDASLLRFPEVPVSRVRPNSRRVSPGDICHVQAIDFLYEYGTVEDTVPLVVGCLYDYYKDPDLVLDDGGPRGPRARAIQESLRCVATELGPQDP